MVGGLFPIGYQRGIELLRALAETPDGQRRLAEAAREQRRVRYVTLSDPLQLAITRNEIADQRRAALARRLPSAARQSAPESQRRKR
jgi:hypothetical protein